MNESPARIADLIVKHLNDELDVNERLELDLWLKQSADHQKFIEKLADEDYVLDELHENKKMSRLFWTK